MILESLAKRVDEEQLRNLIPEEDQPLLSSILRAERRRENAKSKSKEEETSGQTGRTRWIREGEDPMDLLNVEDVTRGITSRKEEDDDDSEVGIKYDIKI